jgi:hypothetical protein
VEFLKNLNSRWSLQGTYTYSRLTGNCEDGDYGGWGGWRLNDSVPGTLFWNPIVLQRMGLSTSDYAASGTLSNNQTQKGRLALLYALPVGAKGRITFSVMGRYDSGKTWSPASYAPIDQTKWPQNLSATYPNLGVTPDLVYLQYYGAYGAYSDNDTFSFDFKSTWDIPIPLWRVHFIGDIRVTNLFNSTMATHTFHNFVMDYDNGTSRLMLQNPQYWGTTNVQGYQPFFTAGRTGAMSAGFRF